MSETVIIAVSSNNIKRSAVFYSVFNLCLLMYVYHVLSDLCVANTILAAALPYKIIIVIKCMTLSFVFLSFLLM